MTSSTLAATARWTAAVRAMETAKEDRLFEDPWAAEPGGPGGPRLDRGTLAGERPAPRDAHPLFRRLAGSRRHRSNPRFARSCVLGAGLDTRAWRLAWPQDTHPLRTRSGGGPGTEGARCSRAAGVAARCERRAVEVGPGEPIGSAALRTGRASRPDDRPARWLLEGHPLLPAQRSTSCASWTRSRPERGDRQPPRLRHRQRSGPDLSLYEALGGYAGRCRGPVAGHAGGPGRLPGEARVGGQPRARPDSPMPATADGPCPWSRSTLPDFPHYWFVTALRER